MSALAPIRDQWEAALAEGYAKSADAFPDMTNRAEVFGLDGALSLGISLASAFAIMRGMQDTIDELRSRLAHLEGKR